jgi:hypothetical protein
VAGIGATSVFVDPPAVEIHHRGVWYAGELLGWCFDESGRCIARVRCVVDGLRHSTWKDLTDLRLPEPAATAPPRVPVAQPAPPPALPWASIGRHEHAAPAWTPAPERARHRPVGDDTQPHALLADRDPRPPVPRPHPPVQPSRIDAG